MKEGIALAALSRSSEIAQDDVAQHSKDDQEAQQQQRVGPQRKSCPAGSLQYCIRRNFRRRPVDAGIETRIPLRATGNIQSTQ